MPYPENNMVSVSHWGMFEVPQKPKTQKLFLPYPFPKIETGKLLDVIA